MVTIPRTLLDDRAVGDEQIFRRVNPLCLRQPRNDREDAESHRSSSKFKGVDFMAWRGDFVDAYIKHEIGICLSVHSSTPSGDRKCRHLAIIFENESPFDDS